MSQYSARDERKAIYHTAPRGGHSNAVKVDYDGYTFDSGAEASRYTELKMLEAAGTIRALVVHPVYELQPAFTRDGKKYRPITYEGDFEYYEFGRQIVEDVKGVETDVFKVKQKLFLYNYPDAKFRLTNAARYTRRRR